MDQETENLRRFARRYWEEIDVEKFQPVLHGKEYTQEQKAAALVQMKQIEQINKENHIEEKHKPLFS